MDTITKKEIIDDLHDRLNGEVSKVRLSAVFDTIANQALDTIKEGRAYPLGYLGKFSITTAPARKGRNPRTGETVDVPERKRLKFKQSQAVKRELNE